MQGVQDFVSGRMLSTRAGTIAVGAAAALLSGLILLVYLNRYRNSVNSASEPVAVLVAKNLIEKGTSGDAVGLQKQFQATELPREQLQEGAITDPASIRGRVAVQDILPGQQLTVSDFSSAATDALGVRLVGRQRALAVPVDAAHGILGILEPGDRIDIYGAFNLMQGATTRPVVGLLARDVAVLAAPESKGKGAPKQGNVVLRLSSLPSAKVAWAVENGRIWVVLRPRNGGRTTPPSLTDLRTVLLGLKPLRAEL